MSSNLFFDTSLDDEDEVNNELAMFTEACQAAYEASKLKVYRTTVERDRYGAHDRLVMAYFSEQPHYDEATFRDNVMKCTSVIRQLAYGCVLDSLDEYLQMGTTTSRDSLRIFCKVIMNLYGEEFLRKPTYADIENSMLIIMKSMGFLGCFMDSMVKVSQNRRDLPKDTPIDRVEVLRTFRVILFSIHSDEWKSCQCQHQTALRYQSRLEESSEHSRYTSTRSDKQDLPQKHRKSFTPRSIQDYLKAKDQDIKVKDKDIKIKIKIQDHKHAKGTVKEFIRIQGADIAKITRKRLKPGKHEHGNGRARKEPGESYQKSRMVNSIEYLCLLDLELLDDELEKEEFIGLYWLINNKPELCMRTRRSNYPNNSNVTIPRRRRKQVSNIVEPEIRTIVAPMAERTMEELLRAPTEGYGEAIVLPEINADHFEIKTNLLQLVQANPFNGRENENPHAHMEGVSILVNGSLFS
ncbi:hypothetical protein Tco_0442824 [Tanacetum coccineum]